MSVLDDILVYLVIYDKVDICPNRPTPAGLVPPHTPTPPGRSGYQKSEFPVTLKCSGVLALSSLGVLAVSILGDIRVYCISMIDDI